MSDQQLHDDIENIVTALKKVIPILQTLGESASDTIDKRLDNSLGKVDVKIVNLSKAITELKQSVDYTERSIVSTERQALIHLKQGVERLVSTDVNSEYSYQISQVIARLDPLIESKINADIDRLVEHKKLSISDHNDQVKAINDKLESNITAIEKKVSDSIDKLNAASANIETISTTELEKLKTITTAHSRALQSVENATDATANQMLNTLTSGEFPKLCVTAYNPLTGE